jgi:uncharacterized protein YlxP (DUF503 family)
MPVDPGDSSVARAYLGSVRSPAGVDGGEMVVGVLRVRIGIFEALSLKDKRRVTRSLKDRLAAKHNVSVAEVGDLRHRQAATLGLAMVANDSRFVSSALSRIVDQIRASPHSTLLDYEIELL